MEATSKNPSFYSAAELAALKLPNFPTTDRAARTRAEAEGWEFVEIKSRGKTGRTRRFKPPPDIAALIEKRLQGDLAPVEPAKPRVGEEVAHYAMAQSIEQDKALKAPRNDIDAPTLLRCHAACGLVYGEKFAAAAPQEQIECAADLYNLLLKMSAVHKEGAAHSLSILRRLDVETIALQLRVFIKAGAARHFPHPKYPGCTQFF